MDHQAHPDGTETKGPKHRPQRVADHRLGGRRLVQAEEVGLGLGVGVAEGHGDQAQEGQHACPRGQDGVGDVVSDTALPP